MKRLTLFENERLMIARRIEEIRKNRENAGIDREIVIAGGEPVLKGEDAEEIVYLKRMIEILDNHLRQKYQNEYIDVRNKTKIPRLNAQFEKHFTSDHYKEKERNNIKDRIKELQEQAKGEDPSKLEEASDGIKLRSKDIPEYEKLLKLKHHADNNFRTNSYYGYMNIRRGTKLPKIDHFEYAIIMEEHFKSSPQPAKPEPAKSQIPPSPPASGSSSEQDSETEPNPHHGKSDDEPPLPPQEPPKEPSKDEEEDLIEVVEVTPWQWIKDHKKQILIALGITALTITTVVVLTQLLPAIMAASQASQVAGLAAEMVTNGQMWHTAIASEQLALHGANTALADVITSISGVANSFDVGSGVWTLGSQALPEFASSAATTAQAAIGKVATLTNISMVSGIGGLGALGAGLLLPKKKSQEYREIKEMIDNYKLLLKNSSDENKKEPAKNISERIITSDKLSNEERNILLRKLQRAISKANFKVKQETPEEDLEEENENDLNNSGGMAM